jgi:Effector-associated domain 11
MIFTERIEKLLASNHIKEVIDEFLRFLGEVPQSERDARHDANQLRGQVIILSGQFTDLNSKINSGTIDPSLANREKSSITNSFVQILNQLPSSYPDLNNYMEGKNEDEEWNEAQRKNTIEEYQDYFSKYPNGKYKAATIKLIGELEEVKQKQDAEIKRLAALEKERRSNDKATENESQRSNTEPKPRQAYSSTANVNVPVRPKSRTGLYIALGALLGIIFIIIIAVAVSGDDVYQPPVDPQPYTPVSAGQWTQSDENNFLIECHNSVVNMVGADRVIPYCDCMLQKVKTKYSSYSEANSNIGSMKEEELSAMGIDCLK